MKFLTHGSKKMSTRLTKNVTCSMLVDTHTDPLT